MKITSTVAALAVIMLCLGTSRVLGQASEATIQADGSGTWSAGVDGVEIEWNPDGTVKRISARGEADVQFPDRRGIYTAQVIAEERAKAAIIRFKNGEDVSFKQVASEIEMN